MLPNSLYMIEKELLFKGKQNNPQHTELKRLTSRDLKLTEASYDQLIITLSEQLSEVLKNNANIDSDSELKLLSTQFRHDNKIDLLFAEVNKQNKFFKRFIIIEDKLYKNNESKSKVLEQILRYSRKFSNYTCNDLRETLKNEDDWINNNKYRIEHAFRLKDFLLIVIGDKIQEDLIEMVIYLKEQFDIVNSIEVVLMELPIYELGANLVVIPHIVGELYSESKKNIQITIKYDNQSSIKSISNTSDINYIISEETINSNTKTKKRRKIKIDELFAGFNNDEKNVFENLISFAESELINARFFENDSSVTLKIINPIKTDQYISLFQLNNNSTISIDNMVLGFRGTKIPKEIGHEYAKEFSKLFNIPIHPERHDVLSESIPINRLLVVDNYNRFCDIVKKTVHKINESKT